MSVSQRKIFESENPELRKIPQNLVADEDSYEDNLDLDERVNQYQPSLTKTSEIKNSIVKKELGVIVPKDLKDEILDDSQIQLNFDILKDDFHSQRSYSLFEIKPTERATVSPACFRERDPNHPLVKM